MLGGYLTKRARRIYTTDTETKTELHAKEPNKLSVIPSNTRVERRKYDKILDEQVRAQSLLGERYNKRTPAASNIENRLNNLDKKLKLIESTIADSIKNIETKFNHLLEAASIKNTDDIKSSSTLLVKKIASISSDVPRTFIKLQTYIDDVNQKIENLKCNSVQKTDAFLKR